jgi:hypothetical protein
VCARTRAIDGGVSLRLVPAFSAAAPGAHAEAGSKVAATDDEARNACQICSARHASIRSTF